MMRSDKEMIYGIRAIIEAARAGKEIDKIFVAKDANGDLMRQLHAASKGLTVPVLKVPSEKLNRLTRKNHQGAVAFITPVTYQHIGDIIPAIYEQGRMPFVVALDGVTDVRNFGAIARSCECAGVDAIVVQARGSAAINSDAVKTSAGALLKIPVCRENSLAGTLKFLSESGLKIVGASEKSTSNYTEVSLTEPLVLLLGSEDTGIKPEFLRLCDKTVSIPVFGTIQSLNVSVAAGVLIYEAVRQRRKI